MSLQGNMGQQITSVNYLSVFKKSFNMLLSKLQVYSHVPLGTLVCLTSPLNILKYYAIMKKAKVDIVFLCRLILQMIGLTNSNEMGVRTVPLR